MLAPSLQTEDRPCSSSGMVDDETVSSSFGTVATVPGACASASTPRSFPRPRPTTHTRTPAADTLGEIDAAVLITTSNGSYGAKWRQRHHVACSTCKSRVTINPDTEITATPSRSASRLLFHPYTDEDVERRLYATADFTPKSPTSMGKDCSFLHRVAGYAPPMEQHVSKDEVSGHPPAQSGRKSCATLHRRRPIADIS